MSVLIIAGSPRKGMFSDRIAEIAEERSGGKTVYLRERKIGYCRACDICRKDGECIQRDDMSLLYEEIRHSDTIVLVSPVYWWQVTAQMKTFIDRLYALGEEVWKGKKAAVILNGAADDDDAEFRILDDAFSQMFTYLGCDYRYLGVGTKDEDDYRNKEEKIREFIGGIF